MIVLKKYISGHVIINVIVQRNRLDITVFVVFRCDNNPYHMLLIPVGRVFLKKH